MCLGYKNVVPTHDHPKSEAFKKLWKHFTVHKLATLWVFGCGISFLIISQFILDQSLQVRYPQLGYPILLNTTSQ